MSDDPERRRLGDSLRVGEIMQPNGARSEAEVRRIRAHAPGASTLRRILTERARDFDFTALLVALRTLGHDASTVRFRGHPSVSPQPTLIHAIEFTDDSDGGSVVTVTVNLGLRSCRSPLPTYFRRYLADADIQDALIEILDMLDEHLIRARCLASAPDFMHKEWEGAIRDLRYINRLDTPAALHSLFSRAFPELSCTVRHATTQTTVATEQPRLGHTRLGDGGLGSRATVPISGFEVLLICHDPDSVTSRPWPREIQHRMRGSILPLLSDTGAHLNVSFIQSKRVGSARLDAASHMGYSPLMAASEAVQPVSVFSGPTRTE
ncbi:MAG: type VI secretion system baseplate subunit TssG [Myxococcota bacterium]